eukprot:TRINITY_DN10004_c0_g1_i1.p1 TRINITY_DN10004_c0_g1~~TRINITY_DN10004_c0_g1_i1.p1  ORF type:complete len:356 (+),score=84.72 TRINITY_DN10004_c0_g1_i1:54-1070(+)
MASTDLSFADESKAQAAFTALRSNDDPTNWVLFTYAGKNTLDLVGSGQNGLEELKQNLKDESVFYGLVRVTDQIDQSVTVKFVFIVWVGEKVPFVQKGKVTTHKGSISSLVGQYHNDVHANNLSELTEEIVYGKVRDASGSGNRVKDAPEGQAPAQSHAASSPRAHQTSSPQAANTKPTRTAAPSKSPGVPQAATVITFIDEENARGAIKALRSDADETDWILFTYEGNTNKIYLAGKGTGGIDELLPHLKEDGIFYALYRTTDTVDNTVAVKFVLILWVGEKVPIIRKARIITHKGELLSFIGQYHVDVECANHSEINEDIINERVKKASGTANYVK